jgi:hypothetical protein
MQGGEQKGGRLAGAGLCLTGEVLAAQGARQALGLDRRAVGKAEARDGSVQGGVQRQVREADRGEVIRCGHGSRASQRYLSDRLASGADFG